MPYKTLIDPKSLGFLPDAELREALAPFLRQLDAGEGEVLLFTLLFRLDFSQAISC